MKKKIKVKKDKFKLDKETGSAVKKVTSRKIKKSPMSKEEKAVAEGVATASEGADEAVKKVISRKFKAPKPQSLTESRDESSLAESSETKLSPPTEEDVKKIKLSKKVKQKKKKK